MVKKSRRQKGAGGAVSKQSIPVSKPSIIMLDYSSKNLSNDDLKLLLDKYMLSKEERNLVLNLSSNRLTELPKILPQNLKYLYCNYNQLTVLPELPQNLINLSCDYNRLTVLPELPKNLTSLSCDSNRLTVLPELPKNLMKLSCYYNRLTVLPELPLNLKYLYCNDNKLTALPKLPLNLKYLYCNDNQLTVLPELPPSLKGLQCSDNQLTVLPELPPSLKGLQCNNNSFIAPFDIFFAKYQEIVDILDDNDDENGDEDYNYALKELIDNVNGYYASQRSKGRNLASLMGTLGRSELQGRILERKLKKSITEKNKTEIQNHFNKTPRNLKSNGTQKFSNKIPNGPLSHIGSFLTGERGSVNQQRKTLKNTVNRSRRNPNEMAVN